MRTAIYARYSSDLQNDTSIADQTALCERYVAAHGGSVVKVYTDRAISGASIHKRPGLQALMADAASGRFDVVVTESISRLSRSLTDGSALFDQLSFHGIDLHTTAQGRQNAVLVGIMATMAQAQLADIAAMTRRAQSGLVREGRIAGGLAYGYQVKVDASGTGGHREIVPEEAEVVRRIFQMYASGMSPRQIAHRLNEESIPGPRGRAWNDTTIRGQRERGTGLLNNTVYIGQIVWSRTTYRKDPKTGNRVCRVLPEDQWVRQDVPDLRIIDDDLWNRVKARQTKTSFAIARTESGVALNRAHRRKHLLSGLLVCEDCGGAYVIMAKDRYGCNTHRTKGTCGNSKTLARHEAERRILEALETKLVTEDHFSAFVTAFRKEADREAAKLSETRTSAERDLKAVEKKLGNLMAAIEDGLATASTKERLLALEAERARLRETIAEQPETAAPAQTPGDLSALYRRQIGGLKALLDDPDFRSEAIGIVQGLIERIEVGPNGNAGGAKLTVHGEMARIVAALGCAKSTKKGTGQKLASVPQMSVVAGAGFEPATFR
ncbi:recombinase family protein, partial [Caenispirillum salinarum]|uniref:recombinase family protein n=1 Tax=Caenispirillum salinarum TaxID=859058 RepID=UPI0005BBD7C3